MGQAVSVAWALLCLCMVGGAQAFSDVAQSKQSLEATKASWIGFTAKSGRQVVLFGYFSVYKCSLKAIKYSLDTHSVDKTFAMSACDPKNPFQIDNPDQFSLAVTGTAKSVSVQLIYADGTASPIRTYEPCSLDDNSTCGRLVRE